MLHGGDGQGKLSHRVKVTRATINQVLNEGGNLGPCRPFGGEITNLLFCGDLTSQK